VATRADGNLTYEFGQFRLDPVERLLVRDGRAIALTPKAFDLLVYLVEHHGRLVDKQALLSALWPDTVVEEANLAYNVSALRKVLDDGTSGSAIQTVPTKGYRFVAPVTIVTESSSIGRLREGQDAVAAVDSKPAASGTLRPPWQHKGVSGAVVLALTVIAAATWATLSDRQSARRVPPREQALIRLTANPLDRSVTSARISPNGRYLAYAEPSGIQIRVIDTGETQRIPATDGMEVYAWAGDSASVRASMCKSGTCVGWDISLFGGSRRRSGATWLESDFMRATQTGSRLVRVTGTGEMTVDLLNGAPARALAHVAKPVSAATPASGSHVTAVNWSVDGSRVLFATGDGSAIQSIAADGGPPRTVFAGEKGLEIYSLVALSDARLLVVMRRPGRVAEPWPAWESSIWELRTDHDGISDGGAVRLTDWRTDTVELANASADGRRLAFLSTTEQEDVYIAGFDRRIGLLTTPRRLTFDDRNDDASSWARDNTTILFTSGRNGTLDIFKQRIDSDVAEPLVASAGDQVGPRAPHDGNWVLYHDREVGGGARIMRVPISGGNPTPLFVIQSGVCHCSTWGRCVILERQGSEFVVSSVDPIRGKEGEVGRIPTNIDGAALLPDGNALAFLVPTQTGPRNRIRIVSFIGAPPTDIVVQRASNLVNLDSLPSGAGFFSNDITGGHRTWLFIEPDGTSHPLWPKAGLVADTIIPSWDGKHLAINAWVSHGNVWMLSGFAPQ
jgi:DNA-binding winged helix-turn-helix (wHTH) protein